MGGGVLGHRLGNGQNHHVHMMALNIVIQLGHGVDGDTVDNSTGELGIDVKGGIHGEAGLGEGEVLQQGMAQIAHTDHNEMVVIVHAENMANLRAQFLYIVAVALLTKFTEAAEILANLGGGNVHLLSQGMGGDPYHTAGAEVRQLPVVTGEAPNDASEIFSFFKAITPIYTSHRDR